MVTFRGFEPAEALHVPIYLHPTQPPKPVIEAWYGGFAPIVTDMLAGAGWGWHIETAVHVIRIILGGTFDRYPDLQLVVGHMGETLPFMLQRLDVMPMAMTKLSRPISAYLRENIHYTFSGFTSRLHFWICCCRSVSTGLCSRPTTLMHRCPGRARS